MALCKCLSGGQSLLAAGRNLREEQPTTMPLVHEPVLSHTLADAPFRPFASIRGCFNGHERASDLRRDGPGEGLERGDALVRHPEHPFDAFREPPNLLAYVLARSGRVEIAFEGVHLRAFIASSSPLGSGTRDQRARASRERAPALQVTCGQAGGQQPFTPATQLVVFIRLAFDVSAGDSARAPSSLIFRRWHGHIAP